MIPTDIWSIGVILSIYEKDDRKDCNNYRGITILSMVAKVFEQVIEKKIRLITESTLSNP